MRSTLRLSFLLIVMLAVLPLGTATADEEDPGLRLSRARDKEKDQRDYPEALDLYKRLLEEPALEPQIRGEALLGVGRCHRAMGQTEEAEKVWVSVTENASLPVDVHDQAAEALNELRAARIEVDPAIAEEEAQRRLEEQRRVKASELLEQARRARDEGRFELARQLCIDALSWAPKNQEASDLLTEIEEAMPDRAELLRTLLRFANTTSIQGFLRLKSRFEKLDREGRSFYKAEDYAHADEAFRKAIQLIDESEFFNDLGDERGHAIRWLSLTIEKAAEHGTTLGAVPVTPLPSAVAPSFQRRFKDLLGEVFTARPDEQDPLVLYDASPPPFAPDARERGLVSGDFPEGISVTASDRDFSRAQWAERWVRANLGTGWARSSASGRPEGPPRILDRFGDLLLVQHRRSVHRKVRELLDGFSNVSAAVAVDVAVLAVTVSGGTRIAERLGVRATPVETGDDLMLTNRLIEENIPLVENLEGVHKLGTARIALAGRTAATLGITQHADLHPSYQGQPAPPLNLAEEESRYGLWLGLYAEDLARAAGAPRAALGVVATTRVPQGTVVVPKSNAGGPWMRLARPMAEQSMSSTRVIPHAGTLILQGLTNPFPASAVTYPGLVILVGVRPAAPRGSQTAIPDTPRPPTNPNGSGSTEERDYDLGPLADELDDAILDRSWPRRPASLPVPLATRRKARELYLASSLGSSWSSLAKPGEPSPVTVSGRMATARLMPDQHGLLKGAVDRFRAQQTALYQVDVVSAETDAQGLQEWLQSAGAQAFVAGSNDRFLIADPAGVTSMERRLRAPGGGSLYVIQSRLLARATQKVAARNLHGVTIVEDLRFWRHTDGTTQRLTPVLGTAEEGIVIQVRPGLETDGRRLVLVDAQAARLQALESLLLPEVELETARITVPRHFQPQRGQVASPLSDDEALVITLPAPEGGGRVIAVMVRVRRVQ